MKWAGMRNIVGSFTWPNHPYFITVMDPFSISLNSIFLIKVYIATFHRDYNLFILILFNYLVSIVAQCTVNSTTSRTYEGCQTV